VHPAVFQVFDELCRPHNLSGAVLEIGATPDESTLLNLPSLAGASEKIGLNKAGASRFKGFSILEADANAMICFPDQRFNAVLCNSVLEHDRFFWKTLAEIRRVTKPGGLIAIGAPAYTEQRPRGILFGGDAVRHSTLTLRVHNFPGDYYRFSEQTFREVFFEGMKAVVIRTVLIPPRIIGTGILP